MSERIKKIEKCWLVLVQWVAKNSKTNKKNPEAVSRRYSAKKEVLKIFAKFTWKNLCWRLCKKELQVSSP